MTCSHQRNDSQTQYRSLIKMNKILTCRNQHRDSETHYRF